MRMPRNIVVMNKRVYVGYEFGKRSVSKARCKIIDNGYIFQRKWRKKYWRTVKVVTYPEGMLDFTYYPAQNIKRREDE